MTSVVTEFLRKIKSNIRKIFSGRNTTYAYRPPGNPNAYFGWREAQAVQSPKPQIARVGPRDLTTERIKRGLSGQSVFSEDEVEILKTEDKPPIKSFETQTPKPPNPEHIVFKSGRRQKANRRKIIFNQHSRGGRSPQNQGRRG